MPCELCETPFTPKDRRARYCLKCTPAERQKITHQKKCELCASGFETTDGKRKYCQRCKAYAGLSPAVIAHYLDARRIDEPHIPAFKAPLNTRTCIRCGTAFQTPHLLGSQCEACKSKARLAGFHAAMRPAAGYLKERV